MANDNDIIARLKVEGLNQFKAELAQSSKSADGTTTAVQRMEKAVKEAGDTGAVAMDKLATETKAATEEVKKSEKATVSYKAQLKAMQAEILDLTIGLQKMKAAGKEGTAEFNALQQKIKALTDDAGELKDVIGDVSDTVKNAASDTRGIDNALRGINAMASGFQVVEGASALFGVESEKLQESLVRLNAVMAISSGLQQLQDEALKSDSVFTLAATKAKTAYNLVVGNGTTAMKIFRLALAALGIGAVIAVVYLAVKAWQNWNENINKNNKLISDAKKAGAEYYASETTKLNALLAVAKNKELSDKTRQIAIDNINKLYPEYLSNLSLENINTRETNKAISQQVGLISKLAMLKGTTKLIEELGQKLADLQTQTGDASLLDRVSTSISSGNWFANAEEATKIFRDKQEKEANEQISKIVALQKKLTSELDKAGFGTQALSALGVELPQEKVKKIAEKTVKAVKKEVEKTPIEIKVEAQESSIFSALEKQINDTKQLLADLYSGDIAAGLEPSNNPQINFLINELKRLETEIAARKAEFDELINGSRATAKQVMKAEGGVKNETTFFERMFGTREENEAQAERTTEIAQGAQVIIEQLSGFSEKIGSIASQAISIKAENELRDLQAKKDRGLITEKEYEKKSAAIKNEAARKQRAIDIANATAQIPIAVLQAFIAGMQIGGPIAAGILAGVAGAFGLAQVALIASAPLPKFRDGGSVRKRLGLIKGKKHEQGGVPIEVEGDEFVMKSQATKKYGVKMLEDINNLRYNPIITANGKLSNKNKQDTRIYENLAIIGSYLKQGYKVDAQGNQILKEISDKLNNKSVYV